jgi:hypothetical protein
MDFPDHRELTGAAGIIERAHVERVRAALGAELTVARARWPGIADADLVGSISWVVFGALAAARDEEDAGHEAAVAPPSYTFDDDDRDGDDDNLDTGGSYEANTAPDPEVWLAIDESRKLAAIEAHHRALAVDLPNPRLHAAMHAIVENQLAANAPAESRVTIERLVAAGVTRHGAVHAIGSVVAEALWSVQRRHASVDHDAMIAALARLDPSDWRDGDTEVEPAAIPPLAHELMYRRVPGLRTAIERAARTMRQRGWTEATTLDPPQLLERATIDDLLERHALALVVAGWDRKAAVADSNLLSVHVFSFLTYELHRKKTFWVDESLAFMLGCTRLDVRGEGLRLPFPCSALVFTDRETLGLAEAVARTDPSASVCGLPLRGLTVYATQLPTTRGVLGLHLAFLLDADTDTWPWVITRDLEIQPDDTLDAIIESRFADAQNPDPVFRSTELRRLVQLVINAILFAGSSPAWPVVGSAPPTTNTEPANRPRRTRAPPTPPERSEEKIWHLPGKIPIRQVRALRQLQRAQDGGAVFSRFMVRGHWRRAPDTWRERNPRWIAPYWKGPPLGDIVEREYTLKP